MSAVAGSSRQPATPGPPGADPDGSRRPPAFGLHGLEAADAGAKVYRAGTHRTATPAETLARVGPLMPLMGITRIANITGLDRVGIPVVMVSRPNSRSLAVSQGKGLDLAAAKVSGVMEAVETFHGETITRPLVLGSARELRESHGLVDVATLPRSRVSLYSDDLPLLWIAGHDLLAGETRWVPYELVHTNYTLPSGPASGCFPANTNGLASGNHLLEAVGHGIYEVVERDAITLWKHARARDRQARLLDLDTVDDPACCAVLDRLACADLAVRAWDVTSDVGIAAFYCLVMGRGDDAADPEFGGGCHPARPVALVRALTEAAQARTTYIAGSRDDFAPEDYTPAARQGRLRACRMLLATPGPERDFRAVPTFDGESLEEDVDWALRRLQAAGFHQVIVVDLTKPEFGLPVARVVIPGLEGPDKGARGDYVPGPRVRAVRGAAP